MQIDVPTSRYPYYGERYVRVAFEPPYVYYPYPPPPTAFLRKHQSRLLRSSSPWTGHSHTSGSGEDEAEEGIDRALVGGAIAVERAPIPLAVAAEETPSPTQEKQAPAEENNAYAELHNAPVDNNNTPAEENHAADEENHAATEETHADAKGSHAPAEEDDAPLATLFRHGLGNIHTGGKV